MKIFAFTFLSMVSVMNAHADSSIADFCKAYPQDQKRIAEVKKNGWVQKRYDYKEHDWVIPTSSDAQYLYGCLDLKWKTQMYQNLCLKQTTKIEMPKAIFFYFDGYGNFRPQEAKSSLRAVNILGNELAGMLPDGVSSMRDRYMDIGRDLQNEAREKGLPYFNWETDMEFHYHSGSGTDHIMGIENAEVCYADISKNLKILEENYPEVKQPKKIIMGYSNGGANAIKFVNNFTEKSNDFFDLLITLDPVPKAPGFVKNKVLSSQAVFKINKKENIGRSLNFYQTSKIPVIAGVMSIEGSQVEGVDVEQRIYTDHVSILYEWTAGRQVTAEFVTLLNK